MSARERRLREYYETARHGLKQAIEAMNQAGHFQLMEEIECSLAKVQKLRETMEAYPQDHCTHKSWAEWIPASNPPAEGKRVLVMLTTGEIWAGHFNGENWTVHVMGICNSITHWMPIPKLN